MEEKRLKPHPNSPPPVLLDLAGVCLTPVLKRVLSKLPSTTETFSPKVSVMVTSFKMSLNLSGVVKSFSSKNLLPSDIFLRYSSNLS